ncbi:uroporphyrinogen-III C-methyltransferase [Glaciecola sp. SC05]|uniref:uroporphyrinogen-III C-methyltransferase n=1 Tax=Glaciecola sp. SC05 TaxID=1987355 RepID=UPI00352727A1
MGLLLANKHQTLHSFISAVLNTFRRLLSDAGKPGLAPNVFAGTTKNAFPSERSSSKGHVVLLGAGPGDPDLLTVKAVKTLAKADVVLFDWLVSKEVLALIGHTATVEFVGKRAGHHSVAQAHICERMVAYALAGKYVVRLKGGDPAIFARTAEETEALELNNIPFSIIPGITAASGASAYSGIPLTHRDCAQSVRFVTATMKQAKQQPHWQQLAMSVTYQTLVFYMGLGRLELICEQLIAHGVSKHMPIALVDNATTAQQIVICGTLTNIVKQALDAKLQGPSVIIVGHVVSKRASIAALTECAYEQASV